MNFIEELYYGNINPNEKWSVKIEATSFWKFAKKAEVSALKVSLISI